MSHLHLDHTMSIIFSTICLIDGLIVCRGAVALDGRIEPGDMILEVNGVSFENMSNDDAVRTLRESVQKPGYVACTKLIRLRNIKLLPL